MATKTRAKFGYLNHEVMIEKIASNQLDAYDIVFVPDKKECYVISPDLTPWSIKSKVYTFDSIESAVEQLNKNTDTYAGQIIAIMCDKKYCGYIVNSSSDGFSVSPLSEQGEIDYNTLGNKPIINLYGEIGNHIIISELNNGTYIINGQYQISKKISTVFSSYSNNIFIVESDESGIYIRKISAKDITDYSIINDVVTESAVITSEYLESNGYITEEVVDLKIAALDAMSRSEAESYIQDIVLKKIDETIDETIESKIDDKINPIDNEKIESLFGN